MYATDEALADGINFYDLEVSAWSSASRTDGSFTAGASGSKIGEIGGAGRFCGGEGHGGGRKEDRDGMKKTPGLVEGIGSLAAPAPFRGGPGPAAADGDGRDADPAGRPWSWR